MKLIELKTAQDEFRFLHERCKQLNATIGGRLPKRALATTAVASLAVTAAAVLWASFRMPTGLLPFSFKKHLEQLIKYSRA